MKKALFTLLFLTFAYLLAAQMPNPVFDLFKFGAIGNGKTSDQQALQKAINACMGTGGTIYIHNGTFLTSQMELGSNMTLFINSTATLFGIQSNAEEHYPHHLIETVYPNRMLEDCQRRLIYGNGVKNVTIKGSGTINGQGNNAPWMNVKEVGTEKDRPSILAIVASTNINVSDLTLLIRLVGHKFT